MVTARVRGWLWLWIRLVVVAAVVTLELTLQARAALTERLRPVQEPRTRLERPRRAYLPFTVQHLHPLYWFFFPLEPEQRLALRNDVCSLDKDGYREPGPAFANGRKLAVLLGGSSAFGHFASSNATTITSYMNRLQPEYFFINAGVPSWNSTQELTRLSIEVLNLHPAVVIVLDGANDASLVDLGLQADGSVRYPAGTPENFDQLETIVDEAQHPWSRLTLPRLFPEITNRIEKYTQHEGAPVTVAPQTVRMAAERYVQNLVHMAALSEKAGARFVAAFQPIAGLHAHVPAAQIDRAEYADKQLFRDAALAARPPSLPLHDLSNAFDADLAIVPVADDEIRDDTIFVDAVHLTDRGNELMAHHLLRILAAQP